MPQRNADALTDICRFWLDHSDDTSTSGGERPHITVTVPYATLTGTEQRLGEIDGAAVSPEETRRLACDAASSGLSPMVGANPSTSDEGSAP